MKMIANKKIDMSINPQDNYDDDFDRGLSGEISEISYSEKYWKDIEDFIKSPEFKGGGATITVDSKSGKTLTYEKT